MIIAILTKTGTVLYYDSTETPMLYMLSVQEREPIAQTQDAVRKGAVNSSVHITYNPMGRPEMADSLKREAAIAKMTRGLVERFPAQAQMLVEQRYQQDDGAKSQVVATPGVN